MYQQERVLCYRAPFPKVWGWGAPHERHPELERENRLVSDRSRVLSCSQANHFHDSDAYSSCEPVGDLIRFEPTHTYAMDGQIARSHPPGSCNG
jgi:hypothetical protein